MQKKLEDQRDFQPYESVLEEELTTSVYGVSQEDLTEKERFYLEVSLGRFFKRIWHRILKNLRS